MRDAVVDRRNARAASDRARVLARVVAPDGAAATTFPARSVTTTIAPTRAAVRRTNPSICAACGSATSCSRSSWAASATLNA